MCATYLAKRYPCQNPQRKGSRTEGIWLFTGIWRAGALALHFGRTQLKQSTSRGVSSRTVREATEDSSLLTGRLDFSKHFYHYEIENYVDGKVFKDKVPMRNAMNEITRRAYVDDCNIGIKRWNRLIKKYGYDEYLLSLPSTKFRRNIGIWANLPISPNGNILKEEHYKSKIASWLPSNQDKEFINSLMIQELELGKTASWIAAPKRGINNQTTSFNYVDLV